MAAVGTAWGFSRSQRSDGVVYEEPKAL